MVITHQFTNNISGQEGSFTDTQYYGEDAIKANFLGDTAKDIYKECETEKGRGIIIGIEDSDSFMDIYYIVYIPQLGKTVFELVNNASFIIYE